MAKHNVGLIVMMIIAIALLFVSMVLSAMGASEAAKGGDACKEKGHKYSMASAIVTGVAVAVLVIGLVIYIFRKDISVQAGGVLQQYGGRLQQYGSPIGAQYAAGSVVGAGGIPIA